MTGDNRHRDSERQNAGDGARGADQATPRSDGHLVAVADRRHGDDRPPEAVRDALDLRAGLAEFGVVDGARVDQQADDERDQKQAETLQACLERHDEDLQADRVFGELEDANQSDDAQKSERRARLCAGATHRRQNVEQRHVVRHDRSQVDDVLKVAPEQKLRRTRDEPDDDLQREPSGAEGFDNKEQVEEVGRLVADAVRHGEFGQRLDAEENDRHERYNDGHDGDYVRRSRRLRVLEVHPDLLQRVVRRKLHLADCIAFRHLVLVDHVSFQLVEFHFRQKDVVGNVMWTAQTTAKLVVGEDGLEARSMTVEKQLVAAAVVEGGPASSVAE